MARLPRIVVPHAGEWRWSSAGARLPGRNNGLVTVAPVLERYGDFGAFLAQETEDDAFRRLRISETTGRPLGSDAWLDKLEQRTGKSLKPQKRDLKPKTEHLE